VIGGGAIGCLFVALLKTAKVDQVIVVERSEVRAAAARAIGADVALTPDAFNERREQLVGDGADLVVDAAGRSLSLAIETARSGGTVLLFGINPLAVSNVRQSEITVKSLMVVGHASFLMGARFPAAIAFLESGAVDLTPLISETVDLGGMAQSIARLRAGEATKVVVVPAGGREREG